MFVDWQLFRRRALAMSLVALVIVFVVWNIPQLNFVLYPFRLFVTFIHEAGHGLAAVMTGGEFVRFEVMENGSGLATTRNGVRAIILPAGYIGASFFGASLFFITNRVPFPQFIALGLSVWLIALSLLFGQTSRIALTVGIAFGVALIVMALFASRYVIVLVLNILAIMTALNAVLDLVFLTRNMTSHTTEGRVLNDAVAFTQEILPTTSPTFWAWAWASASVLILGFVMYHSILKPLIIQAMIAQQRSNGQIIEDVPHYYIEETLLEDD